MSKVSVIIPSREARFLQKTVDGILASASSDIEVIVSLDGFWPSPPLRDDPRLIQLHHGSQLGMRVMINDAAAIATGEFIMKSDEHCLFAEGFDEVLKSDCADNWIVIPRRYSLDAEKWSILETGKSPVDYHYLSCPIWSKLERDDYSMHGREWTERSRERRDKPEYDIDEQMSFQGSCWFMSRKHWQRVGPMDTESYGVFAQEPQEIGNRTWLGPWDGRVMCNKRTWYAHLHKGHQYGRGYSISQSEIHKGHEYSAHYWMDNRWKQRAHDLEWLIDRFWPVPTWYSDWKQLYEKSISDHPVTQ